jgi:hypothetical protein
MLRGRDAPAAAGGTPALLFRGDDGCGVDVSSVQDFADICVQKFGGEKDDFLTANLEIL